MSNFLKIPEYKRSIYYSELHLLRCGENENLHPECGVGDPSTGQKVYTFKAPVTWGPILYNTPTLGCM